MMWNDEDNNPYGTSFERRDSGTSSSANQSTTEQGEFFHPFTIPFTTELCTLYFLETTTIAILIGTF